MIRRWLHGRFLASAGESEVLMRAVIRRGGVPPTWIDWYHEGHVARYGERGELRSEPWWEKIRGRFMCWLDDWRTTWDIRPPTPPWPRSSVTPVPASGRTYQETR